jgi:hypothetical protein
MRTDVVTAGVLLLLSAGPLAAQSAVGKLEGTIKEKIASRSVSAASVSLVRLESETSVTFNTKPDARGRFEIDSLPAGRYLVQLSSPTLDSLDLALPPSELRIASGKVARADLSLPFGKQLRDAICHGLTLEPGKAAVAGRAIDADTDQPIAGADVVLSWFEVSFDKTALKATTVRRATMVKTGPRGEYRMCGVPIERMLSMQLQHAGRAGAVIRLSVSEDEGAVVRDVSLSMQNAPTIAALDSVERTISTATADSAREELQLTGTATLTGRIRGSSASQPLSGVLVRVRDARSSDVTDSEGRFTISGLPSGTQVMLVRQLGYSITEIPVELRPGKSVEHDVQLARAAMLDSVHIIASKPRNAEFEFNRRTQTLGKFLTLSQIQLKNAKSTADLMAGLGGFEVRGTGSNAKVIIRGAAVANPLCNKGANIVINNIENMSINDVAPIDIMGIEAYRDATSAPAKYIAKGDCGLVVIWLRTLDDLTRKPASEAKLKYNGYP